MALIEKSKGRRKKQSPSGYTRLFGIPDLGILISRIHATVISAGNELEDLIWDRVKQIDNLDSFLTITLHETTQGLWVARKKQIKKSKIIKSKFESDFLTFDLWKRNCDVIEIKDGDQFDTKKASGEFNALHDFAKDVSQVLPFSTHVYLCSFNAETKEEIFHGLKGRFPLEELITGRQFCNWLGINFNEIIKIRTTDQQNNLNYFINALLNIDIIKNAITKTIKNK